MLKRFLAFLIGSLLCIILIGQSTAVQAQTPTGSTIDLPFNPTTDAPALQPDNRPVAEQPYDDGRVVIGNDDRSPVLTRAYPWSTIGRLELVEPGGRIYATCTGTLIGRDLILPNSHCLIDEDTNRPTNKQLVFKPSMIKGVSLDAARVIDYNYGWRSGSQNMSEDWALMKLDQPLGDKYGYLGWRNLDFSDSNVLGYAREKIRLAGYSGDFPTANLREFGAPGETAGVDMACSILEVSEDVLLHDCDTNPGASGSAFFGKFEDGRFYILGLHRGGASLDQNITFRNGVTTDAVNVGVQVSRWATQAATMRQ